MNLHQHIHAQLLALLNQAPASEATLNNALRLLAKYRSLLIQNTLLQQHGAKVMAGPFAGLDLIDRSAEGCYVPKLLGCYEEELHDVLRCLPQAGYTTILNIGCAEGYYAVGIKRLLPTAWVLAFDTNPVAQEACEILAARNSVDVEIGGLFSPEDFARFAPGKGERVLVWCDIEGAERDLLNPELAPALAAMNLIVESHECLLPGITKMLIDRFSATHDISVVRDNGQRQLPNAPPWFNNLAHLDQLLAVWEWRSGPTPWLMMMAKAGGSL